ncbi:rod shape-determining protein RodA [Pedobacter hiemivivus]|uniref:Cell wall polymerase n=1 Tax=Pedobacter hiemivivus TaxID=2530454 RepID=A0A4R0NA69_9SPHI|nr:rod shape-determining protein RodA [Pedobacter hiemivivus]TCC95772.1 rod shape-determining protein RodA [Pedobacter hiemivivus]TKC61297.1 rod shape-determining protein RodA [Pedobacter hiemivivus]
MINQQNSNRFFFNVDWITILIYVALCGIGFVNIYASIYNPEESTVFNFTTNYGKQLIFIITGLVLGLSILLLDAKFFSIFSPIIYGVTMLLLIVVLVVGRNVGGNQAWIPIGSFRLQPSELAKFGTALLLARYISSFNPKLNTLKPVLIAALIIVIPMCLIMLQPDAGSMLVFLSFMFPLYREGLPGYLLVVFWGMVLLFILNLFLAPWVLISSILAIGGLFIYFNKKKQQRMIMIGVITFAAIGYLFIAKVIFENVLQPHQRTRIELILGLKTDPKGAGYNVNQSKIAIGSGQLTGRGFLEGTQTKYGYVPEQSTDFIFSTIGEEWGFVGCFVVIALYLFLLLRVINLAERQRSSFSRVYGYCVACIIFFHVFINIGMTIGIIPVIGIPLPFISYGGSSLWSFTVLLFIFLKLDSNRMGFI